jgi:putative pyruvate formate lyase activating enzyme
VSPTHFVPGIISALEIAAGKGLKIPIVYNTNGYEKVETLKFLDGIIDIYLPDMKYSDNGTALKLSNAPKYSEYSKAAVKEMHRQVGNLKLDRDGIAVKGLLVRHLVLPNDLAGTQKIMGFLSNEISRDVHVAIMAQYKPCHKAVNDNELGRKLTPKEYRKAVIWAKEFGIDNILIQELESSDIFLPDFHRADPFK